MSPKKRISIHHLTTFTRFGGGGIAASRINEALVGDKVESTITSLDVDYAKNVTHATRLKMTLQNCYETFKLRKIRHAYDGDYSLGVISAGLVPWINRMNVDIIHLHWILRMLSIKDIGRIRKPLVWTFHDAWPLMGIEHLVHDNVNNSGFAFNYLHDTDLLALRLRDTQLSSKFKHWKGLGINVVCPSSWLANLARQSGLFEDGCISVIPNPIDVKGQWQPGSKLAARNQLNISHCKKVILFSAKGGLDNKNKGGDLLPDVLRNLFFNLQEDPDNWELMILGLPPGGKKIDWPCSVRWIGEINNQPELRAITLAADVVVIPSRFENFPNVSLESQACGVPVVCFNVGGIIETMIDRVTGWACTPLDTLEMAYALRWSVSCGDNNQGFHERISKFCKENFAYDVISEKYVQLYLKILQR